MAEILKAAPLVEELKERIAAGAQELMDTYGQAPCLAMVRVGARPDDLSYESSVIKRAGSLGIETKVFELPEDIDTAGVAQTIAAINADPAIHGCLMFRPLPRHLDEAALVDMLAVEKDVDGVSTLTLGGLFSDAEDVFAPCTAQACLELLDHYEIPLKGKHVVVVGRSLVIGKPVSMMLLARHATVTMCHSRSVDLEAHMRAADIVVCATGRARAFGPECFSAGQTVLDVGINFDDEGKLCGDVDFAAVEPLVAAITPVPGGVGSITSLLVMEHALQAARRFLGESRNASSAGAGDAAGDGK